ncbi:hypothetical protein Gorai_012164 [Gossypium raimondii]|uniref:Uncharacterized protein n=4 Tax=Gossypium raimondii TaxID=29730 RepID=A0A7J8Q173_GOSRA|nr:hypothetical protein [Gossypium raimondii]
MIMEGIASRSELRKELERERRRVRDRQRRQSMSHEEREKHLARRRRNYQLRRQRAETARLYPAPPPVQFEDTSISTIQSPLSNSISNISPQFYAAALVDPNHGQERLMLDTRSSQSLEIPAHKLATLPGKVRLNHIKHLARAIQNPVCDGVGIGGMMKGNGTSNCLVSKGVRLNHIKRLARAVHPIVQEAPSLSLQTIRTEGKNVSCVFFRLCCVTKYSLVNISVLLLKTDSHFTESYKYILALPQILSAEDL